MKCTGLEISPPLLFHIIKIQALLDRIFLQMSEVSFFAARTLAFWPKNYDLSHTAKNVFITPSVVLDCSRKYKQQDKLEGLQKIHVLCRWRPGASQLQKFQLTPVKSMHLFPAKEVLRLPKNTGPVSNLQRPRFSAMFCMKSHLGDVSGVRKFKKRTFPTIEKRRGGQPAIARDQDEGRCSVN